MAKDVSMPLLFHKDIMYSQKRHCHSQMTERFILVSTFQLIIIKRIFTINHYCLNTNYYDHLWREH